MATPQVLILRAPGTNCDRETAFAFETAGARADRLHVNRLLENPRLADTYQICCIPGGFSYGDDVAAGKILANQIRNHLADVFSRFRDAGKLVLGICNGFQVLLKAGAFTREEATQLPATLAFNDSGRFEARWVSLEVERRSPCIFLAGIERLELPVAHAEGRFVCGSTELLERLESRGQVALRYASPEGLKGCAEHMFEFGNSTETRGEKTATVRDPKVEREDRSVAYPANPNGSIANVAGLCDSTGRILGLMPHPERHIRATQHPRWTRRPSPAEGDGLAIFRNAVKFFA
jgi:phosphoribosylformylglycinamidine synthase